MLPAVPTSGTDLTIVIPAKNEAPTIADVVLACRRWSDDVILVDGHSTDDTVMRAASAGARVLYDRGRGKGDAIRRVITEIRTPIVVFIDGDGSHDPADIPELVSPIRSGVADHVSASRLMGGSSELHGGFDEFFRLAGSAFITACINWRFGVQISDSQNGFRALRTEVLESLHLREETTTIEQEMVMKTLAGGFRLSEVPSHEHRRRFGQSHIRLSRVAMRYVVSLIRNLSVPRHAPQAATATQVRTVPPTTVAHRS
jgi:dolichol-phosphate hexosyltransferase